MIFVVIYLYLMGATIMWWFARSRNASAASKAIAVIGWPVLAPVAALWG